MALRVAAHEAEGQRLVIPVRRPREPKTFDQSCRAEGKKWLKANPVASGKEPKDFWSQFEPELRAAFKERCGWLAMWIPRGQVDHYLSKHHPNPARRKKQRPLAYEWHNLRFADGEVNNRKRNRDAEILDPYEVRDGWFQSNKALELEVTTTCPKSKKARANFTIQHLGLDCGTAVIRLREHFLARYEAEIANGMDAAAAMAVLEHDAPLIADYVRALR
jgi:hypothetical protein